MIFYQITFGFYNKNTLDEAIDIVENYLDALVRNGQIDQNYTVIPWQKQVVAYINAVGLEADLSKSHSNYGKELLNKVEKFFKQKPVWNCNEDFPPKQKAIWKNASFLYLFTNNYHHDSPLHRGDNNDMVPLYRVPVTDSEREDIYCWQEYYRECDNIWMGSGKFEIAAYQMLADPRSELSLRGRESCLAIEKATGIPVYYYLLRYFGRKKENEKQRKCPCCGNSWFVEYPQQSVYKPKLFYQFDFQCPDCRLVSNLADGEVKLNYAKIGE
ncbi:MAG: Zn-ribbon-containing protein [Planctomycetaceae bacterium]|nr:Zn-ribbon-containing protein [Planctomycetaceae bacterium]